MPAHSAIQTLRARLDESLFPDPPSAGKRLTRGERAVLAAAFLALATVLQLLRLGWSVSLDSLWAEDGPVLLQGALTQGFWETVTDPYAEYALLVPRLIAELASLAPLDQAPAAMSILSAGVVAVSGLAVWCAAAGHISSPYLRGVLACLAVLVPVAGLEAIDTASYVPWYMLFASFWLLLWRAPTWTGAILASAFVLATALSNAGVLFFLPLAALRALAARDRRDLVLVASIAIGMAVQIGVVATEGGQEADPTWTSDIWVAYLQRVVDGAALGEELGGLAWAHLGWPFLAALAAGAVAALAAGFRRSSATGRWTAAIAIATSLGMFVVSAYQREVGTALMWPAGDYSGVSSRYAIVPALLLVSAALVLLDGWSRRRPSLRGRPWAIVATVALLLVGVATSFSARDTAVRGTPRWGDALRAAASACAAERTPEAAIFTSPPGFGVQLPCERVSSFAPPAADGRVDRAG